MVYRCILPLWAAEENPSLKRVYEGAFSEERLRELNSLGYNIYYLPNYPSLYDPSTTVDGSHIDTFEYAFVDMDLKDGTYPSKEAFLEAVGASGIAPSLIVDSGNGIHVYWRVVDLDGPSYLSLQRRLCRKFQTDEAVSKIYQLMRVPGYMNTKRKEAPVLCEAIYEADITYTAEDLGKLLPIITHADAEYCKDHFSKTYEPGKLEVKVDEAIPLKFTKLVRDNAEVKELWCGNTDDRSKADYRLGHIMHGNGFTKEEATSVLVNTSKALQRAPRHRVNYALGIIEKIWTYEVGGSLSNTVREIIERKGTALKGTRFPCWRYLDATEHGFRLGQVVGLVAGSGVGKTAIALNMFMGFVQNNPDYDHFFIPLEQPVNEIADRWKSMCGDQTHLYDKVHVISNYDDDGNFRHLSFDEIKEYLLKFKQETKKKIGCVVIDHIGALKKKGAKNGENQDLMDICHSMKAFAVQTDTLLVMQSQAPREKAGIGDLELNKDAAYGTVFFESYCDYVISLWQPLKRCYSEGAPTVTAFKFCKIRHKKQGKDVLQEDVRYKLMFDPSTGLLRELTQDEESSFRFWLNKATNERKKDRKTDLIEYSSITWTGVADGKANHNTDPGRVGIPKGILN